MKSHTGLGKGESGLVLIWALILMAIGMILLVPVLELAGTSLRAAQIHETKTLGFYAADAGLQDAMSRIRLVDNMEGFDLPEIPGDQVSYTLQEEINGRQVDVTIENLWLLGGIESEENGTMPHQELVVTQSTSGIGGTSAGYKIEVSYDGSAGNLKVQRVAVWLPAGFSYVAGSASGITTDEPTQEPYRGGIGLMWEFQPAVNFEDLPAPGAGGGFTPGTEYPAVRELNFDFEPATNPVGSFAWIRTNRADVYLSWDTECGSYRVDVTAIDPDTGELSTAQAYVGKGIGVDDVAPVYGDYRVLGESLMLDTDHDASGIRDTLLDYSTVCIKKHAVFNDRELPDDAQVEMAYLYWSAWWEQYEADTKAAFLVTSAAPQIPQMDLLSATVNSSDTTIPVRDHSDFPDTGVLVIEDELVQYTSKDTHPSWGDFVNCIRGYEGTTPVSHSIYTPVVLRVAGKDTPAVITASTWWILENKPGSYAYSCRADITSLLSEMSAGGDGSSHYVTVGGFGGVTDDAWSYAGWSLIVIYSSESEDAHQLYLYDDFLYADEDTSHTIDITGFQAPSSWEDSAGRLTYFVGEGDECYTGDSVEVNDLYLSDGDNPTNNVMNGKSSGLGGGLIDGVDVDTFDVSAYINPGDTSAEIRLSTGIDSWNLCYIILSFRSEVAENWLPRSVGVVTCSYD